MLLKKLIKGLPKKIGSTKVLGLATHSQKVKKGYIFFAIRGHNSNGEKFINEAVNNGAIAIICSKKCNYKSVNTPVFKTADIRFFLSETASKFYHSKPKNIIAVTGTNGKTSVADLFYQILNINKINVASIGTLGIKFKNKIIKSDLTSPDTIHLHQILQKLKKNKIDNVIIEASSHGLDQKRVDHLNFKAGIFTNFSQDHLDYHRTMKKYLNAKLRLFKKIMFEKKFVISDKSIKEFSKLKKISSKRNLGLIDINPIKKKLTNLNLRLNNFQMVNLSMAVAAARICNLNEKKIINTIPKLKSVDGRLELIKTFPNNIKVFVDFAHTPDALYKSIKALKNSFGENISLVFGCGGNRDFKKRPLMAKIASSSCKKIYVTDDNPRNEKPEKIRGQLIKNIINTNCFDIADRSKAIKTSIMNASPNEVILVAGKGHESKQIYKNKVIFISDKKIIKQLRVKLKKISYREQDFSQNKKIFNEIKNKTNIENFQGLAIDSRLVKKNNLFLTIKGKNKDGKNFIHKVIKKGVKYIVSSKKIKKYNNKIIKVSDEIKFLNNFAIKKRNYSSAQIFAITGSSGKTSLKDLISNLLKNFDETFSSPKSYNNHFGVPLSISNLSTKHRYGVFEVGMSKAGEIDRLSKLIKPHIAIITNIGEAHIENFKNLKGIADAKGEIINNIQKDGVIILNRDDKFFNFLAKKANSKNLNIVTFGMTQKADVHPISISKNLKTSKLIIKVMSKIFKIEVKNINIYNVLSSLALLKALNLNVNKILKLYKEYEPSEGRGKIHKIRRYKKNFKLIDESYNANPISVKNAIKNFNSIKKKNFKKYLILGDMLELGHKSNFFHKELSKVINNSDIDKVFVKGAKTLITYKNLDIKKRGNIFHHNEDVDFTMNDIIANNDYLMIKGSNATGLNYLSKNMIKGY